MLWLFLELTAISLTKKPRHSPSRLLCLFQSTKANPHAGKSVVYVTYFLNRRHSSKVRTFIQFLVARMQALPDKAARAPRRSAQLKSAVRAHLQQIKNRIIR
ncbi:hypothetical protein FVF58_35275 [Paraburkholderia panacisoli]|uniref:Uncharacterized protein n=1 Tax=Paraburkholderia panacisoli TaxID=2603818 RepID=A0A5B0GJW7_9BURK|nr:hypothetical protein [Paraburkholderia panacisoli]KAA1003727.1 hypothetical protein FVF58_35275 [Paraburkholderia panacisoli]